MVRLSSFLLGLFVLGSCSSNQSVGDLFSSAHEGGVPGDEGGLVGPDGAAIGPAAGACVKTAGTCTHPDQCCSHLCVDGVCIDLGACQAAGSTCTAAGSCCSGRCEPVTGMPVRQCLNYCLADGVTCDKATDCCSFGCFGGKCGGGLCKVESENCTISAECCSNICDPGRGECRIDEVNRDCRGTGESCTSGTGSGCCDTCNKAADRCDFGPGTCRAQGVGCTRDADCCKGQCLANGAGKLVCQTPCAADGAACQLSAECCGFNCAGNPPRCGPPVASPNDGAACKAMGTACTGGAECCSSFCIGGFCDVPCAMVGAGCHASADCCSGVCGADSICADPPVR